MLDANFIEKLPPDQVQQWLAAIVDSSFDAILSKSLDGTIQSWNKGAELLFQYTAAEAIGRPITMLIPEDRRSEEAQILKSIRAGKRVEQFETQRQRKDGSLIDVSLTVSPIRNKDGEIIGASKIARDVTAHKRAAEQQELLVREMDHRIRNLFALVGTLVSMSAKSAETPDALARSLQGRIEALCAAQSMTWESSFNPSETPDITLHNLIDLIVRPYSDDSAGKESRFKVSGPDFTLSAQAVTGLALLLHELCTNAAKYGALTVPSGYVEVIIHDDGEHCRIVWKERNGPKPEPSADEGFGSLLVRNTVEHSFEGTIDQQWGSTGLVLDLTLRKSTL